MLILRQDLQDEPSVDKVKARAGDITNHDLCSLSEKTMRNKKVGFSALNGSVGFMRAVSNCLSIHIGR